jgi:hypothetical protein
MPSRRRLALTIALLACLPCAAVGQVGGKWVRTVERDRHSGERATFVAVLSTNAIDVFGRRGRGKLTVGSQMTLPMLLVDLFGKLHPKSVVGGTFASIESWCDDDKPEKVSGWVATKDNAAHVTLVGAESALKRMTTARTFSVKFKAIDDEEHTLTFPVTGIASHANFLEIKIK